MNKGYDFLRTWAKKILPRRVISGLRASVTKSARDLKKFRETGSRFTPRLPDFPPMVMIDTTTRCNLRCAHCPNSALSATDGFSGDMDVSLYLKIVDEIAAESPDTLVRPFDGGEPLMRKDLGELIAYGKTKGLRRMSINTNGTLLSAARRKDLIEAGLDHIEVSIDAASKATYAKIRRCDLYDRVVEHTLAYIEESKAFNSLNRVSVSFVLQKDNRHEADAFREFWERECDEVFIREYHEHHEMVEGAGRVREGVPAFRHPCPYLWNRLIVYHDGRVRFCEMDWNAEHSLANVRDRSIREIWHGPEYTELRRQHVEGDFRHSFCRECADWPTVHWGKG